MAPVTRLAGRKRIDKETGKEIVTLEKQVLVRQASGLWRLFLLCFKLFSRATGNVAMINPFRYIPISLSGWLWEDTYFHELAHIEQVERFTPKSENLSQGMKRFIAALRFILHYAALFCRYGYEKHPYEIEARTWENKRL